MKKRLMVLVLSIVMLWNFVLAGTIYAEEDRANNSQTNENCRVIITYTTINKSIFYEYDTCQETVVEYV